MLQQDERAISEVLATDIAGANNDRADTNDGRIRGQRACLLRRIASVGGELRDAGGQPAPRPGTVLAISALRYEQDTTLPHLAPVIAALAAGYPVQLSFSDLAACNDPPQVFEDLLVALVAAGVPRSSQLGLCIDDDAVALRAFALQSRCYLGDGPRYLLITGAERAASWSYLQRHQFDRWAVWPAYGSAISSQCPLLAEESADAILPPLGLRAPAQSRWLALRIDLNRYADQCGTIRLPALNEALDTCLDCCEQLLDLLLDDHERSGDIDHKRSGDIALNRRIAFDLRGFGDLVRRQGDKPSALHALQSSMALATHIRRRLWERSRQLAQQSVLLPAIARSHPVCSNVDDEQQRGWTARWQAAVERHAVRHRNLVVISPYAVLPRDAAHAVAYADLLPLIRLADAHAFADPPDLRGWSAQSFRNFHQRARAVVTRDGGTAVIATRV